MKRHYSLPHGPRIQALLSALVLLTLPGCLTTTPPSTDVQDTLSLSVDLHLQEEATAGKQDRWEVNANILWTPARLDTLADNALFAQGTFALPASLPADAPLRVQPNGDLTLRKENLTAGKRVKQDLWLTPSQAAGSSFHEARITLPRCPSRALKVSLPADTELVVPDAVTARITELGDRRVHELYLSDDQAVTLRWRRTRAAALTEKLVATSDTRTSVQFRGGIAASTHHVSINITQGSLPQCRFELPSGVQPVRVAAPNLRTWNVVPPEDPGGLRYLDVIYTTPQHKALALQIHVEQDAVGPVPLAPLYPNEMARRRGAIVVGTPEALRLEVDRVEGMNQQPVDPLLAAWTKIKIAPPPQNTARLAWQCPTLPAVVTLTAEAIEPVIDVQSLHAVVFEDSVVRAEWNLDLDLREAPVQQVKLVVDAQWLISEWRGDHIADVQQDVSEDGKTRTATILFKSRLKGRHTVALQAERPAPADGVAWSLRGPELRDARTHRGYLILRADNGWDLEPTTETALLPVHPARAPLSFPDSRFAYRFKSADWEVNLKRSPRTPSVVLETLELINVGDRAAKGSAMVLCRVDGAPVHRLTATLPAHFQNVDWSGPALTARPRSGSPTTWDLEFRDGLLGSSTLMLTWHIRLDDPNILPLGTPQFSPVAEHAGTLLLTGEEHVRLSGLPETDGLHPISHLQVPEAWRALAHQPLMQAFQISSPGVDTTATLDFVPAIRPMDSVAEYARIDSFLDLRGDLVTRARYHVKNANAQYFAFTLPADTDLWRIRVAGQDTQAMRGEAEQLLVPLPASDDPNQPVLVELEYAGKDHPSGWRPQLALAAPSIEGNAGYARWHLHASDPWRLRFVEASALESGPSHLGLLPLLQRWGQATSHLFQRESALVVTLGIFLLACLIRPVVRGFFATILRVFMVLSGAVFLIALLAATGQTHIWNQFLALPDPGQELVLTRPVLLDGGGPAVTVQAVPVWLGTDGQIWPLGVAAAAFLLVGVLAAKRVLSGPAALWVVACLLLWSGSHLALVAPFLPWGVSLLALWLIVRTVFRLGQALARFRPAPRPAPVPEVHPPVDPTEPAAAAPGRTRLGLPVLVSSLLLLAPFAWTKDKVEPEPKKPAPAPASVWDRVDVQVTVNKVSSPHAAPHQVAQIQAVFTAEAPSETPRTLPDFPGALTGLEASDGVQVIHPKNQWVVQSSNKKPIRVSATYVVPIRPDGQGLLGLSLPAFQAAWRSCSLTLPDNNLDLTVTGAVRHRIDAATGELLATPQFNQPLRIHWVVAHPDRSQEPARFFTRHHHRVMIEEGGWTLAQAVEIQTFQGALTDLSWTLPTGWQILSVQAPGLAGWSANEETRRLTVRLDAPLQGTGSVFLLARRAAPALPYTQESALPQLTGAERDVGSIALAPASALTLSNVAVAEATPLPPEEAQDQRMLAPFADQLPQVAPVLRAFRYRGVPPPVTLEAALTEPDLRVVESARLDLSDERVLLASKLDIDIRKAGLFKIQLRLPDGFELETLTGSHLDRWQDRANSPLVDVYFQGKIQGPTQLNIHTVRRDRSLPETLPVPRIRVPKATRHRGSLVLASQPGLQTDITTSSGLRELALAKNALPGERRWNMIDSDWALTLGIRPGEPRLSATVVQQGDLRDSGVQWSTHIRYNIERVGVRELHFVSPWPDAQWHFTGKGIARVHQHSADATRWTITLQDRVMPSYRLSARTHRPRLPGGEVELAALQVADVDRTSGWMFITAAPAIQPIPPKDPQGLIGESPRNLPPGAAPEHLQRAHLAWRVVDPSFRLTLPIQKHDAAPQLPAHIQRVDLSTTVAVDGAQFVRARIDLDPGRARFLDLTLPPGMSLWGATVNHSGVICLEHDGTLQIPLDQAGGETTRVDCIYAGNGGSPVDGQFTLTAPGFSLPLHNVTWAVNVPEGFKYEVTGGNVEEITTYAEAVQPPDEQAYLSHIAQTRSQLMERAEAHVRQGEQLARKGKFDEARRLFAGAMQETGGNAALNEDARVLHLETVRRQLNDGLRKRWDTLAAQRRDGDPKNAAALPEISEKWAEQWVRQNGGQSTVAAHLRVELPSAGKRMVFRREVLTDASESLTLGLASSPQKQRGTPWPEWAGLGLAVLLGLLVVRAPRKTATPEEATA